MKNIKTLVVIVLLTLIGVAVIIGWSQLNKPHVDVWNTKADYIVFADSFINDFSNNEMVADKKYVNKIIEINGKVSSVSSSNGNGTVTFNVQGSETGITCNFQSSENIKTVKLKTNQPVIIKGICTGMLIDIMMKECVIVN